MVVNCNSWRSIWQLIISPSSTLDLGGEHPVWSGSDEVPQELAFYFDTKMVYTEFVINFAHVILEQEPQ